MATGGGSLRRVWRALPVAVVPLAVACGGSHGEGAAILTRAQDGLRRLGSSAAHVHVRVETPVPVERNFDVSAAQLPKLDLTRWANDPKRVACGAELECAKADIDVDAALRAVGPLLPSLPVDPKDVRSASVNVAVEENGRTRYVHIHGKIHVSVLGDVPFEADLDVTTS